MRANFKSAIRFVRKWPSFAAAVILTLALGIGANTAVFSAINAILIRPLPFPNSDELVVLREYDHKAKSALLFITPVRLTDWNRLNTTFQAITGYYTEDISETTSALPEKLREALVAPRFLQVWGMSPIIGREFKPEEEHFGGPNAVLISERFWRRRFNSDPGVIGKRLRVENYATTIIGVMPASFLFPDHDVDLWAPSPMDAPYAQSRESTWFTTIGRLKPTVTIQQARENLNSVQVQLGRQFPKTDAHLSVTVEPLKEITIGAARRSLWVLFGSVSLLLLIACTNIAALLLSRTAEREREIAIRFSIGASRWSLIAQLLTESLGVALAGSVVGLFAAAAGSQWLRGLAKSLPRAEEIRLDWRILLYTLASALLCTLVFGLIPALRGTRRGLAGSLAQTGRAQVSSRNPLQWVLVSVQVALAVTLLVGAGLLFRTFQELGRVSPGFEISHILTLRISANWGETADYKKLMQRIDRTLNEIRGIPGVAGAAVSAFLPGVPGDVQQQLEIVENRNQADHIMVADSRYVSDGYFAMMRIPVLAGQTCRELEGGTAVVNRSFADRYLGGSAAIGHHVRFAANPFLAARSEIRGVVADAREQGLNREPAPTVYWCLNAPFPSPYFLIRTQRDPMAMAETIRRKIHQIEPARAVFDISPLEQHLSDEFAETRLRTLLLGLFAVIAISLACIGLYGTLNYFVAVRRREVGLRMALGALHRQIIAKFLFQGIRVALSGCAAGLFLAFGFSKALAGMLYGVSRLDPTTYFGVIPLIIGIAAAASLLPAFRAARVDPMEALRDE